MKNQVLSIEQMKNLQRLGVDTSKASMCWIKHPNCTERDLTVHDVFCYEMSCLEPVPTFTLQDLIELLPNVIDNHVFGFNQDYHTQDGDGCYVSYTNLDLPGEHLHVIDLSSGGLLTACHEMLLWLIKNKHIKQI